MHHAFRKLVQPFTLNDGSKTMMRQRFKSDSLHGTHELRFLSKLFKFLLLKELIFQRCASVERKRTRLMIAVSTISGTENVTPAVTQEEAVWSSG